MLGNIHASATVRKLRALWAHAGISLVAAGALAAPCCNATYVKEDCVKATTSDVSCAGGITTGHLNIEIEEGCSPIVAAEFISYNNRDGKIGYDPDGTDIAVDIASAANMEPTHNLTIGSFSSGDTTGTIKATNWALNLTRPDGTIYTVTGKY